MSTHQDELNQKLIEAVKREDLAGTKALIDAGADANVEEVIETAKDWEACVCRSPVLHLAIGFLAESNRPLVEALLDAGADINARDEFNENWTPLMNAAFCECPEIVEMLIDRGADTTLTDDVGRTVFGLMLSQNDDRVHDVLVVLTRKTADGRAWLETPDGQAWVRLYMPDSSGPLVAPPVEITDVLRAAIQADGSDPQGEIMAWVEAGGDLEWRTPNGWTLLHLAAQMGNEKMVRFLVARGADIEARDNGGETPLMLACEAGYAALRLNPAVVEALLELGANPRAKDDRGATALQLAGSMGVPEAQQIAGLLKTHKKRQRTGGAAGDESSRRWWQFWK